MGECRSQGSQLRSWVFYSSERSKQKYNIFAINFGTDPEPRIEGIWSQARMPKAKRWSNCDKAKRVTAARARHCGPVAQLAERGNGTTVLDQQYQSGYQGAGSYPAGAIQVGRIAHLLSR